MEICACLALLVMTLLGAADVDGREGAPSKEAAPWQWRASADGVSVLELRFIRGQVTAETTEDRDLAIEVLRSGQRSDPYEMMLEVTRKAQTVVVTDRYRPIRPLLYKECLPPDDGRGDYWHTDVRAKVLIRLPSNVALIVHLVQGDVDVTALTGPRTLYVNDGLVRGEHETH